MLDSNASSQECLNIAIDHRIQRLFTEVELPVGTSLPSPENDTFDDIISCVRKSLRREPDQREINVTKRLAGPYKSSGNGYNECETRKGITILLQQPAEYHPYEEGTAEVVRQCVTLNALHEIFQKVSLQSVGISDINVLDTLPCVRPSDEKKMPPIASFNLENAVAVFIHVSRPAVIICASRKPDSSLGPFQSLGVGKVMPDHGRSSHDRGLPIRVNAFHPSLALNLYPYEPMTRQLLLLEVLQACRQHNGTWQEEPWMNGLRKSCENSEAASPDDKGKNSPKRRKSADSARHLFGLIRTAADCISESNSKAFSAQIDDLSIQAVYQMILDSKTSEYYNQMALCILEIERLQKDDFARVPDEWLRNKIRDEVREAIEANTWVPVDACKSIVREFLRIRQGKRSLLNLLVEPHGQDAQCPTRCKIEKRDPYHLQCWRSTLTECSERLKSACRSPQTGPLVSIEERWGTLRIALLQCAKAIELLLGQFVDKMRPGNTTFHSSIIARD